MARIQLIAGAVAVAVSALSILATLLAVGEIEVQFRWREAEPTERLQRAGVGGVPKLPGAARGSPGPPLGGRSAPRATGEFGAPRGGHSVLPKMAMFPTRPAVATREQPAMLMELIGQARGGELAWESMRRNVLMHFNVTLAIVFPCLNGSRPTALHKLATYDWCYAPEPYDWEALFDSVNCSTVVNPVTANPWGNSPPWRTGLCNKQKVPGLALLGGLPSCIRSMPRWKCYRGLSTSPETIKKCRYIHTCVHTRHTHTHSLTCMHAHAHESRSTTPGGSGGIIAGLRLMALRQIRVLKLDETFSQMILTRSDYLYLLPPPHPRVMNTSVVYIPRGQDFGGVTDRYIAGSMAAVLRAMTWPEGNRHYLYLRHCVG